MDLTVFVFHYMRGELLERCLSSIKRNVSVPHHLVVLNDPPNGRLPIGEKKAKMVELCETPFFTKLDNDMLVHPMAVELQLEALKNRPGLAICSGITLQNGVLPKYLGVARFRQVGRYLMKLRPKSEEILRSELYYADLLPTGHTTWRLEAFKELCFDERYDLGYSHWDTCTQIWLSKWRGAVHTRSLFDHRHSDSPHAYHKFHDEDRLRILWESRRNFIDKWGLRPVEFNERTLPGMFLHGVNTLGEMLR